MFDDQTDTTSAARGVIYSYDVDAGTASMVWQYKGSDSALSMGSFRVEPDGTRVIGWGEGATTLSVFSEIDENGNDLLDFSFPNGEVSYRAIKVPTTAFDINLLRATAGTTGTGTADAGTTDAGQKEAGPHDAAPDVPISCTGVVIDAGLYNGYGCMPTAIPLACFPPGSVSDAGGISYTACTAVCPTTTPTDGSYCELVPALDGGAPDTVWCFADSYMP